MIVLRKFRRHFLGVSVVGAVLGLGLGLSSVAVADSQKLLETAALPPAGATLSSDLPDILNAQDAGLYAQIFDLQEKGKWRAADKKIAQLSDRLLMGHVLYQRYMHPTAYRSKYKELKDWMANYNDHPGAKRIYRLALRRQPKGWKSPVPPASIKMAASKPPVVAKKRKGPYVSRARRAHMWRVQNRIKSLVRRERPTQALKEFSTKRQQRLFTPERYDQTLAIIARGYYHAMKNEKALEVAGRAVLRSKGAAPMAYWWGGLAAWRLGKFDVAADYFGQMAVAPNLSEWPKSAAAYWASRAYLADRQPAQVTPHLAIAAAHPHTFYGLLAIRALGRDAEFNWQSPGLGDIELDVINRVPAATRALALVQIGDTVRAEAELKRFANDPSPELTRILLALSQKAQLPDVSIRIGSRIERSSGDRYDAALYPVPGWEPVTGFKLDRALIFAHMRQESRFRAKAKSRSGARGLMQLMPATASFIDRKRYRGAKRRELFDPSLSIELGQKYILHLMEEPTIGANLFYTMVAYNAGPGNLRKWRAKTDYQNDPLLFIESVRSREARNYVERVMTNLWAYRLRLGQATPSLDAVAAGQWPTYIPLDNPSTRQAQNANQ